MKRNLAPETFSQFKRFLIEVSGIDVSPDRAGTLEEKLTERMQTCRIESYEEYLHYLKFNTNGCFELKALLDLITIGETFFFRNGPQFEVLQTYILPELIEKKQDTTRRLRIWSAGCSTGEEPYSVAMALRNLVPNIEAWEISILATDVNRKSLEAAHKGVYGKRSVSEMPPDYLGRFFEQRTQHYHLSEEIKKMVEFQYHNLATEPFSLPGMLNLDILFCRNVTIYFDLETLKRVVSQFADCLTQEGIIFIGHAETLWGISDAFQPVEFPQTFLYRKLAHPTSRSSVPHHIPFPLPEEVRVCRDVEAPPLKFPQNLAALMEKGTLLANQGRYREAIECMREVVTEDNLSIPARYLLGVLLEKTEEYQEAIEEFRRVIYIDSKFSVGYFHLGNLYRYLGHTEMAMREYRNCVKLLKEFSEEDLVPLSEGLTAGVLCRAAERALEMAAGQIGRSQ